jgi:hypothetical protein
LAKAGGLLNKGRQMIGAKEKRPTSNVLRLKIIAHFYILCKMPTFAQKYGCVDTQARNL